MTTFNIKQTKLQLEELLGRAAKGEKIIITRWKKPIPQITVEGNQTILNEAKEAIVGNQ